MEDTAPLRTSTVTLPPLPRTHGNAPDNATIATDRRSLLKKRAAVIVGLLALTAGLAGFCVLYGPELLAFVADAPRFRAWVDETGWISRIVFVLANMAQVVFAFLPGEPLELGAGYAFGFWEGTLWCLVASALGTAAVMALVRAFGIRIVGLFFSRSRRCAGCATPDVSKCCCSCAFSFPGRRKTCSPMWPDWDLAPSDASWPSPR